MDEGEGEGEMKSNGVEGKQCEWKKVTQSWDGRIQSNNRKMELEQKEE